VVNVGEEEGGGVNAMAGASGGTRGTSAPTLVGDRYELGPVIGYGGMAEVHRGLDTRLGRTVAIKVLRASLAQDETFQERFRREATASASLNHPCVISVYDTGDGTTSTGPARGLPYIVMEYVEGRTLRDVLREGRRILPERALEITAGILSALDYSHRMGIVHRDIKPANVMLTPAGEVKVMDFGIARAVADTSTSVTQTAAVIGTAQYLSPEQARGEVVGPRGDIYSVGVVLYELLVGRPPFTGASPVALALSHVRDIPESPDSIDPDISAAASAITMCALAKEPDQRYPRAAAMREDIERALAGRPVWATSMVAGRSAVVGSTGRRGPRPGGAAAGVAGAGVAGAAGAAGAAAIGAVALGTPGTGAAGAGDGPGSAAVGETGWIGTGTGPGSDVAGTDTTGPIGALGLMGGPESAVGTTGAGTGGSGTGGSGVDGSGTGGWGAGRLAAASGAPPEGARPAPARRRRGGLVIGGVLLALVLAAVAVGSYRLAAGPSPAPSGSPSPSTAAITVPDVRGKTAKEAQAALSAVGLSVRATATRADPQVPAGRVISQTPGAGASAARGDSVDLVVSSGPGQVRLPDVVNQPIDAATAALTGAGLKVDPVLVPDKAASGTVVASDPVAGQSVDAGSTVTLQVANGTNAVPDTVGSQLDIARTRLGAAGFDQISVLQQDSSRAAGTVLDQAPRTGQASLGSTIQLVVASPPRFTPTPSASTAPLPTATDTGSPSPSQGAPSPTGPASPTPTAPTPSGTTTPSPTPTRSAPGSPSPTGTSQSPPPTSKAPITKPATAKSAKTKPVRPNPKNVKPVGAKQKQHAKPKPGQKRETQARQALNRSPGRRSADGAVPGVGQPTALSRGVSADAPPASNGPSSRARCIAFGSPQVSSHRASIWWPCPVRIDSGWNCTPSIGSRRCRAAITVPSSV